VINPSIIEKWMFLLDVEQVDRQKIFNELAVMDLPEQMVEDLKKKAAALNMNFNHAASVDVETFRTDLIKKGVAQEKEKYDQVKKEMVEKALKKNL